MLRRGVLRIGVTGMWETYRDRFGEGAPGNRRGDPERLGTDFAVDSLGARQIPGITPLVAPLRDLSGLSDAELSLGALRVRMDVATVVAPVTADIGVTRRLTFGVRVPYVSTRTEISVNPNPGGGTGNLGLNPALSFEGARTANGALVGRLSTAAANLQALIASCQAMPAQPRCGEINAAPAMAQTLIARAATVATGIATVYGTPQVAPGRFVPVARSPLQTAIEGKLGELNGAYRRFLGLAAADPDPIAGTPIAAPIGAAPFSLGGFRQLLADSAFGIAAATLDSAVVTSVGDIEVGAKFLLVDTFGGGDGTRRPRGGFQVRAAVGAAYRFGTGTIDSPDDFADIGTGDGQDDIEARGFLDLMWGRRFWMSIVGRYGIQMADEQVRRITDTPSAPFPALFRKQAVSRDLGDYMTLEVAPRVSVGEYLAFSAVYRYRNKGEDKYGGTFAADPADPFSTALDAATLNQETAQTEQRLGGALSYSTLGAYYRGETTVPVDLSLVATQAFSGTGNAPRSLLMQVQMRYHVRLFGADGRRPAIRR